MKINYSLASLLWAIPSLGIVLAMYLQHRTYGITLSVLPVLTLVSVARLTRHSRWRLAILVVGSYLACWLATAYWGIPSVEQAVSAELVIHPMHSRDFARLDFDPYATDSIPKLDPPWYVIGNGSSPGPFIVTMDYSWMAGPTLGEGGKQYWFWFFGLRWRFGNALHWLS